MMQTYDGPQAQQLAAPEMEISQKDAEEMLALLKDMVSEEIDYCDLNKLGDPCEGKHNVRWALDVIARVDGVTPELVKALMWAKIKRGRAAMAVEEAEMKPRIVERWVLMRRLKSGGYYFAYNQTPHKCRPDKMDVDDRIARVLIEEPGE